MDPYFSAALFFLYAFFVSAARFLGDRDYPSLMAMKKIWGRKEALAFHFVTRMALPLVAGICLLGYGATTSAPHRPFAPFSPLCYKELLHTLEKNAFAGLTVHPAEVASNGEIPHLLNLYSN